MELTQIPIYESRGLDAAALQRLAALGDLILGAELNVTGVTDPQEVERVHFLDSLSLLGVPGLSRARRLGDVGSGGGLPALILALALPATEIFAIESVQKKCVHITRCARVLGLKNVQVYCARAEEYGRAEGRASHDVVVSRAVASLPVIVEYSLPLLRVGGLMVAMKGAVSDQERIQAERALGILGAERLDVLPLDPFEGAHDRWAYLATKARVTPDEYPRRPGVPAKRPLGGPQSRSQSERRAER